MALKPKDILDTAVDLSRQAVTSAAEMLGRRLRRDEDDAKVTATPGSTPSTPPRAGGTRTRTAAGAAAETARTKGRRGRDLPEAHPAQVVLRQVGDVGCGQAR